MSLTLKKTACDTAFPQLTHCVHSAAIRYLEGTMLYIIAVFSMTVQGQGEVAVLDFVLQSCNGNVDQHEAFNSEASDGEKQ